MSLGIFTTYVKRGKLRILEGQYFKNSIRGTVKLSFGELGHRTLAVKNWLSILYSFVTAQC